MSPIERPSSNVYGKEAMNDLPTDYDWADAANNPTHWVNILDIGMLREARNRAKALDFSGLLGVLAQAGLIWSRGDWRRAVDSKFRPKAGEQPDPKYQDYASTHLDPLCADLHKAVTPTSPTPNAVIDILDKMIELAAAHRAPSGQSEDGRRLQVGGKNGCPDRWLVLEPLSEVLGRTPTCLYGREGGVPQGWCLGMAVLHPMMQEGGVPHWHLTLGDSNNFGERVPHVGPAWDCGALVAMEPDPDFPDQTRCHFLGDSGSVLHYSADNLWVVVRVLTSPEPQDLSLQYVQSIRSSEGSPA